MIISAIEQAAHGWPFLFLGSTVGVAINRTFKTGLSMPLINVPSIRISPLLLSGIMLYFNQLILNRPHDAGHALDSRN